MQTQEDAAEYIAHCLEQYVEQGENEIASRVKFYDIAGLS